MKKALISLFFLIGVTCVPSCGYHLGGTKPPQLAQIKSLSIRLFENQSLEPYAGTLVTNSAAEALQTDGTFKILGTGADARVEGKILSISYQSLRSSDTDSYRSTEMGLNITVSYSVIDTNTNKCLMSGETSAVSSLFAVGNMQTARANALSYAARIIGQRIATHLSNG